MKNWFLFYVNMTYVPKLRNSKLKTKVCHFMNARVQTSKLSKKKTIISNLKMTIMLCQTSQRIIEFTRGNQHYYQPQWFHLQNLQLDIVWIVWSKRKEPTLTMNDLREKNDAWDYWLQLFHKCLRRVAAENFQVLPMEDANYRIHYVEAIHLNVFSFVKWLKLIFCSLEKESWRYQEISRESQMNWNGLTRLLSFQSYHTGQISFPYRKEELRNYFQFQNCKKEPIRIDFW